MPATRIRAAAVQALQLALLVLCLLPLWPLWWAIFSIFGVLTVARGLRNTDSYPGPHWLKWPLAVVSLPLKLAAGLAWTLYAFLTLTIHPFTLLAVEILRLCKRPTWGAGLVQVAPAEHGGQTIDVKVQGRPTVLQLQQAPPEQGTAQPRVGLKGLKRAGLAARCADGQGGNDSGEARPVHSLRLDLDRARGPAGPRRSGHHISAAWRRAPRGEEKQAFGRGLKQTIHTSIGESDHRSLVLRAPPAAHTQSLSAARRSAL